MGCGSVLEFLGIKKKKSIDKLLSINACFETMEKELNLLIQVDWERKDSYHLMSTMVYLPSTSHNIVIAMIAVLEMNIGVVI